MKNVQNASSRTVQSHSLTPMLWQRSVQGSGLQILEGTDWDDLNTVVSLLAGGQANEVRLSAFDALAFSF